MRRTILSSGFIGRLVIVALSATLAATLTVAAFTSTGAAQANTANVEEGFDRGGYAGSGGARRAFPSNGVPLLKTFIFQYVPSYTACVPEVTGNCFGGVDHHMGTLQIWPNWAGDKILIDIHDVNEAHPFYYNVQHYFLNPAVHSIRRYDTGSLDAFGQTTKTIARPTPASDYEFVLLGFNLRFALGYDRHINEVGIIENDGKVTVEYNDALSDRPFEYRIFYAYVPRNVFSSLGERSSTFARDHAQQAIPDGPAVIRGFRFDYRPTCFESRSCFDHHIKKIGVENQGGRVQVRYADKNGDDPFDWRVKWGILR